ncbi:MAG TPA: hypothetical protein VK808_08975 [Bacteroidia bacterium]|nr:hypothetical protein [Bacteroidia bacterium]
MMKKLFSICILALLNTSAIIAQDTWTSADGLKYTKDDGIQNQCQKDNPGTVLFSVRHLDPVETTPDKMAATFSISDNIYAKVLLTTCLSNYKIYIGNTATKNGENNYFVYAYIDGVKQNYKIVDGPLGQNILTKTMFSVVLKGEGDDASLNNPNFINSLNTLTDGNHSVKIEVWAGIENSAQSKVPIATGHFTISRSKGNKASIGINFGTIKALMSDPELESNILAALKEYAQTAKWIETYTDVKIMSNSWTILHNDATGAIIGRIIGAAGKANWPDGHCTFQIFTMEQQYDGSAYQKSVSVFATGEQTQIDCK